MYVSSLDPHARRQSLRLSRNQHVQANRRLNFGYSSDIEQKKGAASAPAPSPEVAWAPEAALSPLLSWINKGGISSVSTLCMDKSYILGNFWME